MYTNTISKMTNLRLTLHLPGANEFNLPPPSPPPSTPPPTITRHPPPPPHPHSVKHTQVIWYIPIKCCVYGSQFVLLCCGLELSESTWFLRGYFNGTGATSESSVKTKGKWTTQIHWRWDGGVHFDEIFVTGPKLSNDFWCSQWQKWSERHFCFNKKKTPKNPPKKRNNMKKNDINKTKQ